MSKTYFDNFETMNSNQDISEIGERFKSEIKLLFKKFLDECRYKDISPDTFYYLCSSASNAALMSLLIEHSYNIMKPLS